MSQSHDFEYLGKNVPWHKNRVSLECDFGITDSKILANLNWTDKLHLGEMWKRSKGVIGHFKKKA